MKPTLQERGLPIWQRLDRSQRCLCPTLSAENFFKGGRPFSDLSEVLDIGTHPLLNGMMRMSGIAEDYVTGGASDYDKLEALVRVLPLWAGHPLYAAIHDLMAKIFDCHLPLSLENLPHIWQKTARRMAEETVDVGSIVSAYGYGKILCRTDPTVPDYLHRAGLSPLSIEDMTHLLSPDCPNFSQAHLSKGILPSSATAQAEDRVAKAVQIACEQDARYFVADLSSVTQFPRPHPYPVGQAYVKLCEGEALTAAEKDMFTAQMLRCLLQNTPRYGASVALTGVSPSLFSKVKAYFSEQKIATPSLLIAETPEDTVELARMGAKVALKVDLYASERRLADCFTHVAAGMPLGTLKGLYLPVTGLLDLPLADRARQILCGCLADLGESGMGPADTETLRRLADRILLT